MSNYNRKTSPFCPSCHMPYSEHPGLTLTCNALMLAQDRIAALQEDICIDQKTIDDLKFLLSNAKAERNKYQRELIKLRNSMRG